MSAKYFRYHVSTKTSLELPDRYILHDLDLCFNYKKILEPGVRPTIKNILELTPETNEFIDSCDVKRPNSYRIDSHFSEGCYQIFNVTKYAVHSDICYTIKYRNRSHEFYYEALSNNVNDTRAVFRILVPKNSRVRMSENVRPVVYGHGFEYPYLSMTLATGFWFGSDKFENSFWSDYFMFKTFFLPAPYETKCRDYSQNICIHDCLTELTLKEFNEIPYSLMTDEPYDHVHINLSDPYKDKRSNDFYVYCARTLCYAKSCTFHFVSTFTFKFHSYHHNTSSFSVATLSSPDTYVHSVEALNVNEYVIFIMSCAGSWLGVSILGLNPVSWYQKRDQKRNSISCNTQVFDPFKKNVINLRKSMLEMERRQRTLVFKFRSLDQMNRVILEVLGREFL